MTGLNIPSAEFTHGRSAPLERGPRVAVVCLLQCLESAWSTARFEKQQDDASTLSAGAHLHMLVLCPPLCVRDMLV